MGKITDSEIEFEITLLRNEVDEVDYEGYQRQWVTLRRTTEGSYTHEGRIMFPVIPSGKVTIRGFRIENCERFAEGLSAIGEPYTKTFGAGVAPALSDILIEDLHT